MISVLNSLNAVSVILWMISIGYARLSLVNGQKIGYLGLVSILSLPFLISISMLTFSFVISLNSSKENEKMLFFQVVLLIVFLTLTPAIVEGTARFVTAYSNYSSVDYIFQNGNINSFARWEHNWPGFSILYNALVQISALPEQVLLKTYPTFFNIALLLPLLMFFRQIVNDKKLIWIAIWAFYIANWIGQDYFSMQSLGFLIFVLIISIMFKLMNSGLHLRQWYILLLLFFSALVTSHMLSSAAVLAVVFVFFASKNFRSLPIALLFTSFFALWNIYGASTFMQGNLPMFISQALRFDLIFQANVGARIVGSTARIIVTRVRLIFSALVTVFSFSGLVLAWKHGGGKRVEKRMALLLIGVSILSGLAFYGGELFMRIFLFSLIPLCYFIYKGSDHKIFFCFFASFLIIAAPSLHMIARYGNEAMDYVPPSELAGVEFFYNTTTHGYVVLNPNRDSSYRHNYEYFALYRWRTGSRMEWKDDRLVLEIRRERLDWPRFVGITYGTFQRYDFFAEDTRFIVEISKNLSESIYYNKFYSNPSFDVYVELRD